MKLTQYLLEVCPHRSLELAKLEEQLLPLNFLILATEFYGNK